MKNKLITLMLCFVFCGCAATDLKPVMSSGCAFEDDEKRLWSRSSEEEKILNKSGLVYKDEELETYINLVARKLQPPGVYECIPFKIMIIKNHLLNAFAFPNGVIYLHTGILARMENEAQLATILGHEMTHFTHRHLVKEYRNLKNNSAFMATMQVTIGGLGAFGNLAAMLGTLGAMAAVTGYSKELETEADMEALSLLIKAGYDINESPKLFSNLKQEIKEEKIKEPFFFGSHPRLQERIENYEDFLKTQKQTGGVKNTELFLKKTIKVILLNADLDLKAGRFKIAQRGVEKYLSLNPDDSRAYYLLGEIFRQKGEEGDLEKAKAHYQKAVSIAPSYPEPYKGIGLICFKQGDKVSAKKFFELYLNHSQNALDKGYIEEYIKQCSGEDRK